MVNCFCLQINLFTLPGYQRKAARSSQVHRIKYDKASIDLILEDRAKKLINNRNNQLKLEMWM